MKNWFVKLVTAVALLAVAAVFAIPAAAQTRSLKANIPFAFSTGSSVLPAGDYHVDVDLLYNRITLRSKDGRTAAFLVPTVRSQAEAFLDQGALVFARYGNDYFLRKLSMSGPAWAFEWGPSKAEKQVTGKTPVHVAMVRIALL